MYLNNFYFFIKNLIFLKLLLNDLNLKIYYVDASKNLYNLILPNFNTLNQSLNISFLLNKKYTLPKLINSIKPITRSLPILNKINLIEHQILKKNNEIKKATNFNSLDSKLNQHNIVFVKRNKPKIEFEINSKFKIKFKRPIFSLNKLTNLNSLNLEKHNINFNKNFEEECYQIVELSSLPIRISSPNYSKGFYLPDMYCIYNLTFSESPHVQKIKINIIKLNLEYSNNCERDYLGIVGSDLRFCGEMINKKFILNQTNAQLIFKSDSKNELKGFKIEVLIESSNCETSIMLKNLNGEFKSPNYPLNYPDSFECWTLLDGSNLQTIYNLQNPLYNENFSILFTFENIEMEADPTCSIDFVELYEIDLNLMLPKKILGRFCEYGNYIMRDFSKNSSSSDYFQISGNQVKSRLPYLYVHFKSDKVLNSRGFKANYKLEFTNKKKKKPCTWKPNYDKQIIYSPQFPKVYPPNFDCTIEIKADNETQKIELTFNKFIVEPHINCNFDKLMIYKSNNLNRSKRFKNNSFFKRSTDYYNYNEIDSEIDKNFEFYLNKQPDEVFCGKKKKNFKYISNSNVIKLRFISDDFGEYPGFILHYNFLNSTQTNSNNNFDLFKNKVEFEIEPKSSEVKLGSSHILYCKPKNYQPISNLNKILDNFNNKYTNFNDQLNNTIKDQFDSRALIWYKDDLKITKNINDDGTMLLIHEFTLTSQGNYKCKFGNVSKIATLKIKFSECSILFQKRPNDFIGTEGESTILECSAVNTKQSKVQITWKHNNKTIISNERIKILSNNYLLINNLTSQDTGYFYCMVESVNQTNCFGQAIAQITVKSHINIDQICGVPYNPKKKTDQSLINEHGKIVGGTEAFRGEYPWQVMFWDAQRNSFCGGAILNERWLITAAHCFKVSIVKNSQLLISQIVVRLGKHDQKEIEKKEIVTQIADYYLHPQYNPETFDNDLALIQIRDHIKFNEFIQPICLGDKKSAKEFFIYDKNKITQYGYVTGWGQIGENGLQPRYLQKIKVPLVERELCEKSTAFKVTENMFCAGYGQELVGDACKGDSGSPFTASFKDGKWYLIGIVSWGEGCGRSNKYGFYTKIANYMEWIRAFIQI